MDRGLGLHDAGLDPRPGADVVGSARRGARSLRAGARGVRAARDVRASPGGAVLPRGAGMPRRAVGARRPLRRRVDGHHPGVRPGRDAEPRRAVQPGVACGAPRPSRRGSGDGRRPACGCAEANDDRFNGAWNHAVLGLLELSFGDLDAARHPPRSGRSLGRAARLGRARASSPACRIWPRRWSGSAGSRRPRPSSLRLEASATGRDRAWAAGTAARARALLAAAGGDLDAAAEAAERSIVELERARSAVRGRSVVARPRPDPPAGEAPSGLRARRSTERGRPSSSSAPACGRSEQRPSSDGSAAGRPRTAS